MGWSASPTPRSIKQSLPPPPGARDLQERLHVLLTRLAKTTDLIKTWPDSEGDDASTHHKTTTKLINAVLDVVKALQDVEGVIKADAVLKKSLQECKVPINLLDLLDHGNGLNPDCFSRGLVQEALGQLAGLKRRKLALEMLGAEIKAGLDRRDAENKIESCDPSSSNGSQKRKLDTDDNKSEQHRHQHQHQHQQTDEPTEPTAKKMRKEAAES
mmetsp:Transcript_18304/g.38461  ORF Transcript_18304/g.38461 Transcript_18304/m.38461 type:complete len:214 (-) Transcript_18304:303-944(-)